MKIRARWIGPPPQVGDFLMSTMRPRFAYRVEEVTNASSQVHWDSVAKAETRRLQIVADRVAVTAVPKYARIHSWKWDRRESRHKGTPK